MTTRIYQYGFYDGYQHAVAKSVGERAEIEILAQKLKTEREYSESKDKLIEQMRKALSDADDLIDEYAADYEHRDNVDEIRDEIKAALEAAEMINK